MRETDHAVTTAFRDANKVFPRRATVWFTTDPIKQPWYLRRWLIPKHGRDYRFLTCNNVWITHDQIDYRFDAVGFDRPGVATRLEIELANGETIGKRLDRRLEPGEEIILTHHLHLRYRES